MTRSVRALPAAVVQQLLVAVGAQAPIGVLPGLTPPTVETTDEVTAVVPVDVVSPARLAVGSAINAAKSRMLAVFMVSVPEQVEGIADVKADPAPG